MRPALNADPQPVWESMPTTARVARVQDDALLARGSRRVQGIRARGLRGGRPGSAGDKVRGNEERGELAPLGGSYAAAGRMAAIRIAMAARGRRKDSSISPLGGTLFSNNEPFLKPPGMPAGYDSMPYDYTILRLYFPVFCRVREKSARTAPPPRLPRPERRETNTELRLPVTGTG